MFCLRGPNICIRVELSLLSAGTLGTVQRQCKSEQPRLRLGVEVQVSELPPCILAWEVWLCGWAELDERKAAQL